MPFVNGDSLRRNAIRRSPSPFMLTPGRSLQPSERGLDWLTEAPRQTVLLPSYPSLPALKALLLCIWGVEGYVSIIPSWRSWSDLSSQAHHRAVLPIRTPSPSIWFHHLCNKDYSLQWQTHCSFNAELLIWSTRCHTAATLSSSAFWCIHLP